MALTPRHFCAWDVDPTDSALFRRAEAVSAGVSSSIKSNLTPPVGHGIRTLRCVIDAFVNNTFEAHDIVNTDTESQFFLTYISLNFLVVDIKLHSDPTWTFVEFVANGGADVEWSLEIKGGTGQGFNTHQLRFIDSAGTVTLLANDPFNAGSFHEIRVLWKHASTTCWFKIDKVNPNVNSFVNANCLKAGAGNATVGRMHFRGPVGTVGTNPSSAVDFSLYTHSEVAGFDDINLGNFAIKDLRITGKAGTTPDFGFGAGGTATVSGTADNITDDALNTFQTVNRHFSGAEWGAAYACNLSDVVGGPSGMFGRGTDVFLCKFSAYGQWSATFGFGRLAIGRAPHDMGSSGVNISTAAIIGSAKGWEAIIESGDANFPVADNGDWLVVGVGNAGGGFNNSILWQEGWGWVLYDQDTGESKEQVFILGDTNILGKTEMVA